MKNKNGKGNRTSELYSLACSEVKAPDELLEKVIGMENGNMRDLTSVKLSERDVYCGMALAILSADKAGTVTVKAEADGLQPATITFAAK